MESFIGINNNNTITTYTKALFRAAIGAGTSSTTGTVTQVAFGDGMDFTTFTTSGTITMGTPSTVTGSTTNAVATGTHSHALTLASADITGALGFTPYNATNPSGYTANAITMNNILNASPTFYAPGIGGTSGKYLAGAGLIAEPVWTTFPTIPTVFTLGNDILDGSITAGSYKRFVAAVSGNLSSDATPAAGTSQLTWSGSFTANIIEGTIDGGTWS